MKLAPKPISLKRAIREAQKMGSKKPPASEVLLHKAYQLIAKKSTK